MSAYLDASVLLPTLVEEPASAAADDFLGAWAGTLWVSDFAAAEVASALSRLYRTNRMSETDARERLADFDTWRAAATEPMDFQASDIRLANAFVRRFELMLRAPDALHAAICRRNSLTLVTLDKRLATAAKELQIAVHIPPTAGQALA